METPLVGVSCFHMGTKAVHKFMVFQAPAWNGKEAGGGLGYEALKDEVGTETFDEIDDEVNIFVGGEEMEVGGTFCIFLRHAGALDELELVEFEGGDGQRREGVG